MKLFLVLVCAVLAAGSAIAQSFVRVVHPTFDSPIQPGSSLLISIEASSDIESVSAYLTGLGSMSGSGSRPFSFVLDVPKDALGTFSVVASGRSSRGVFVDAKPITIRVGAMSEAYGKLASSFVAVDLPFAGARTSLPFHYVSPQGEVRPLVREFLSWRSEPLGYVSVVEGYLYGLRPGDASLIVSDGISSFGIPVSIANSVRGDLNNDGIVDARDLAAFRLQPINVSATGGEDARDLNRDGKIDALDLRVLTTLCSRPRCAAQ